MRKYNVHIKRTSNIQSGTPKFQNTARFLTYNNFSRISPYKGGKKGKEKRKELEASEHACMTVLHNIMYLLTLGPTHACNMYTAVRDIADIYTQVQVCNMWYVIDTMI